MRDLQSQIRDYFDELGEPVTIEDVFFANAGDDRVRPVTPLRRPDGLRRPLLVAAGAALAVLVFVGLPLLFGNPTTPSTVPPVTEPRATTTSVESATTTTSGAPDRTTTTEAPSPPTTLLPLPADRIDLEPALESVLADLIVAATDLELPPPFSMDAGLELDDGSVYASLANASVRVYLTEEEAAAAVAQSDAATPGGEFITPVAAGDESFASFSGGGGRVPENATYVVRAGTWVIEARVFRPEDPDEAHLDVEPVFGAIIEARGRGAGLRVVLGSPAATLGEVPAVYEHGWAIRASIPGLEAGDPDSPEPNPVFIERSHSLAITDSGQRCRFLETPLGEIEPQDYTEYLDDGSGVISLRRRYFENGQSLEENVELDRGDPRYVAAQAACNRFEPIDTVLDVVVNAMPPLADRTEVGVRGDAYPSVDGIWVVVDRDERSFELDQSDLVTLGITEVKAPDGVQIDSWSALVDARIGALSFSVGASGQRSALEAAFGVDLSDLPDRVLNFSFEYEFRLEPDGPNQW